MTRNEYIQALKQLPKNIREKHELTEPFDFTPYKCIHTDKYDYYPELNCCVINEVPIQWEYSDVNVNPENPEHFTFMKKLSDLHQHTDYIVVYISDEDQKITCEPSTRIKLYDEEKHLINRGFKTIPFENKLLYYDPNRIDITPTNILLIKCLFYTIIHSPECIIPEPNVPASEWMTW